MEKQLDIIEAFLDNIEAIKIADIDGLDMSDAQDALDNLREFFKNHNANDPAVGI